MNQHFFSPQNWSRPVLLRIGLCLQSAELLFCRCRQMLSGSCSPFNWMQEDLAAVNVFSAQIYWWCDILCHLFNCSSNILLTNVYCPIHLIGKEQILGFWWEQKALYSNSVFQFSQHHSYTRYFKYTCAFSPLDEGKK